MAFEGGQVGLHEVVDARHFVTKGVFRGNAALDDLAKARDEEGRRLESVLSEQLDEVEDLTAQASASAAVR